MQEKISGSVLVYTRTRVNLFLKEVAKRVFDGEIISCSDWSGLEPINLMNSFYRHYRLKSISQDLTEDELHQITARCRVLRLLPPQQAKKMVHAMYQTITELVEQYRPSYFLSLSVDHYISDIFCRVCERYGVFTIMVCAGSLPNTITLTRYGERNQVKIPTEPEVNSALKILLDDTHRITYLQKFNGYSFFSHLRCFTKWWFKYIVFRILSLVQRDSLNYRYLSAFLHTLDQGQSSLLNYQGVKFFDCDWEDKLKETQKPALFIPLAYIPEMTVDYWLKDLNFLQYENFMFNLCKKLSHHYVLIVKEHWAMLGFRKVDFYQKLSSITNVVLVPAQVNSRSVMKLVDRVLVGAGTAGIEAAVRGKRVVTMCTPYYYLEGYYLCLSSAEQIDKLPDFLESFTPPPITEETQFNLVHNLLESTITGSLLPNEQLNTEENLQTTSENLKKYLLTL